MIARVTLSELQLTGAFRTKIGLSSWKQQTIANA